MTEPNGKQTPKAAPKTKATKEKKHPGVPSSGGTSIEFKLGDKTLKTTAKPCKEAPEPIQKDGSLNKGWRAIGQIGTEKVFFNPEVSKKKAYTQIEGRWYKFRLRQLLSDIAAR